MRWVLALGLFCALFWLAPGTNPAFAEALQTVTATFEPYFQTSTPFFDSNNTCPTALPSGWGTVTPGLMWQAQCGGCLAQLTPSSTPQPTRTPNPSQTAPATANPSITPTVTATPMPNVVIQYFNLSHTWTHSGNNWLAGHIYADTQLTGPIIGVVFTTSGSPGSLQFKRMNADTWTNTSDVLQSGFTYLYMPSYTDNVWVAAGLSSATIFGSQQGYTDLKAAIWPGMTYLTTGAKIVPASDRNVDMNWELGFSGGGNMTVVVEQLIAWGNVPATPTPMPQGATYCAAVDDGGLEFKTGIELPGISIGTATCYGLPEVTIPLAWAENIPVVGNFFESLNLADIYFPAFQICFKPLQISNFVLMGVSINVEVILLVMAGATLIRWVLRS